MKMFALAAVIPLALISATAAQAQTMPERSTGEPQFFARGGDLSFDIARARDKLVARDFIGANAILRDAANQTYSPSVQLMAGLASAGVGNLAQARNHLRRALSIDPGYIDAKVVLAIVSKRMGDVQTAVRLRDDVEARALSCDGKCRAAESLARGSAALRKTI